MKIFGKKISWNMFSVVIDGKPKTLKTESKEESEELLNTLQKAASGDEEAQEIVKEKIDKPIEQILPNIPEIKKLNEEIIEKEKTVEKFEQNIQVPNIIKYLAENPDFEVKGEGSNIQYFLKGFKSDLPLMFVEKIAELISRSISYSHLVKFWMMNLLNPNAEARRGLYKFLKKQKMIITKEGYFIAFRRLEIVEKGQKVSSVKTNTDIDPKIIEEFADKVKRWKKSQRVYEVYQDKKTKELLLKKIQEHEKNNKEFTFKGTLYDVVEGLKTISEYEPDIANETTYTDNYTHTMVIRLLEPVRMDRAKCDSSSSKTCSFGLHLGSEDFVAGGRSYGSVIVACLVNAQHVVSVPYADAKKMRVSEYMPFKVLTLEELREFGKLDITPYEIIYKEIEDKKLAEAYNVIDELTVAEKKEFKIDRVITSQEDIDKLLAELEDQKKTLNTVKKGQLTLLSDDVSTVLDQDEIKLILKNRLGR